MKRVTIGAQIAITSTGANEPRRRAPADLGVVLEGATRDEVREFQLGPADEVTLDLSGAVLLAIAGLAADDLFNVQIGNQEHLEHRVLLHARGNIGGALGPAEAVLKGTGSGTSTVQVWIVRQ